MKNYYFLLLAVPLFAQAAPEPRPTPAPAAAPVARAAPEPRSTPASRVARFDKAHEGSFLGDRERVNPTSNELRELSKEQGIPVNTRKGFPVLREGFDPASQGVSAESGMEEGIASIVVAPSYRTLGDAAKAGVDPLSLVKPMTSTAAVQEGEGANDIYYWVGGIGAFIILGGLGFVFALRTPKLRED